MAEPIIALRLEAHRDYNAVDVLSRVQRALEAAGFRLRDLGNGADCARVAVVTPPAVQERPPLGVAQADEVARLTRERDEATGEVHRLRARLRRSAQILIEVLGADGPTDVETMAVAAAAEIVARRVTTSNRLLEQVRNEGIATGAEEGYGRGLTDGAREERAAVVAHLEALSSSVGDEAFNVLVEAATDITLGEHVKEVPHG